MSEQSSVSSGGESYHGPAKASWIILGLACIAAAVPFLGFASWLIAGPLLTITFVLGIVVITRGGTGMGIGILLATLIVAPVFIFLAPIVMSFLGVVAGTGAALHHYADEQVSANVQYESIQPSSPLIPSGESRASSNTGQTRDGALPKPPAGDSNTKTASSSPIETKPTSDYDNVKQTLQEQSPKIFKLKNQNIVTEGLRGYLTSSDTLDLSQRELVQRENYNREKMFDMIAKRAGKTSEEVAAAFAAMARRFNSSQSTAPVSRP